MQSALREQVKEKCRDMMNIVPPPDDCDYPAEPDSMPDFRSWANIACDQCLGGREKDSDGDGVPDDCDYNPFDRGNPKKECSGTWNKQMNRCELITPSPCPPT
jgi:hypothetical protein